jgi:hypothetical protein
MQESARASYQTCISIFKTEVNLLICELGYACCIWQSISSQLLLIIVSEVSVAQYRLGKVLRFYYPKVIQI